MTRQGRGVEVASYTSEEDDFSMDDQKHAQQTLMETFRRDQAQATAHPPRKPHWQLGPLTLPWLLAVVVVVFILLPAAFLVIYPRFGPVDTMTSFCRAVEAGNNEAAYGLLSKHAQQQISRDDFAQASQDAKLLSCAANHGIPIIFGGTQASLDARYEFLGGVERDGSMTFVRQQGAWRVDTMSPDLFHLSS